MIEINVDFIPRWCSFGACVEVVLQTMGSSWDFVDVLGHTALAFRVNVSPRIGVSGPTSLDWISLLPDMANQLGYEVVMVHGMESEGGFQYLQQEALDLIHVFLREGRPVIAWDIWIPEFGLIIGIDEKKQKLRVKTVLGNSHKSLFPAKKLGRGTVPLLLVFSLDDPLDDYDPYQSLYWSFQAAWKHLEGLEKALPSYTLGLKAYDVWIKALQNNSVAWDGHAYMLQYLLEVRGTVPIFLERIINNLGPLDQYEGILREVKNIYETNILPILARMSEQFPFTRPFISVTNENELTRVVSDLRKIQEKEKEVSRLLKNIR